MAQKHPEVRWDSLELSATPLCTCSDILLKDRRLGDDYGQYRVAFEIKDKVQILLIRLG